MKFFLKWLLIFGLFVLALNSRAATRITAVVTVTNGTVNADTITVNGSVRTWTNNVVTSATQILTNSTPGGAATNLWNHIVANSFSGPIQPAFSSTNVISLLGAIDQAMTVTINATAWATVTYTTNTVTTMQTVRVPISSEVTASVRTNIATLLVSNVFNLGYSTENILEASTAMSNYVALVRTNNVGNKRFTNSTFEGILTNGEVKVLRMRYDDTNANGIYFYSSVAGRVSAIAADANGLPTLYGTAVTEQPTNELAAWTPSGGNLLTRNSADAYYGRKDLNNTWTGTNTFSRITNSAIVGSTLTLSTYTGTIGALTNGLISGTGITNSAQTNITFYETNAVVGAWDWRRANNTSLANGNNAGIDFGTVVYVNIKAGPTAAFTINGIAGGRDGRYLILVNHTGQNMTLANESGVDPTPANRIKTLSGSDIVLTGNGSFALAYDSEISRWVPHVRPPLTGAGTGNVTGPASSIDNALVRWDGTAGTAIQSIPTVNGITLDDNDDLVFGGNAEIRGLPEVYADSTSNTSLFLAGNGDVNFIIDNDNDATTQQFSWLKDGAGITYLMNLAENGRLRIGDNTAATAVLHIKAGTATASTAPLKFTSGTSLTTPEAGTVEYDGSNFFATPGATRYKVATVLTGSAALNFDLTAVASQDLTITVTGAADGDVVALGVPNGSVTADTLFWAWVSSANTVTVRAMRIAGTPDPASGTFKVSVHKE